MRLPGGYSCDENLIPQLAPLLSPLGARAPAAPAARALRRAAPESPPDAALRPRIRPPQVWVHPELRDGKVFFAADSDSQLTKARTPDAFPRFYSFF